MVYYRWVRAASIVQVFPIFFEYLWSKITSKSYIFIIFSRTFNMGISFVLTIMSFCIEKDR